jgi:hypothetical protein
MANLLATADKYLSILHTNPYVSGTVGLFLVMYAGLAAPQLPANIAALFENSIFKVAILSLVLILKNYNPSLSILVAVGFLVSMNTLSKYRIFAMATELDKINNSPLYHGSHGDMKANKDYQVSTSLYSDREYQGPQGMQSPPGYDGNYMATYGLPESQL